MKLRLSLILAILLFFGLFARRASAAIALVHYTFSAQSVPSTGATITIPSTTAGDTLIVVAHSITYTSATVSAGASATTYVVGDYDGWPANVEIWAIGNCGGGITTISNTISLNGGSGSNPMEFNIYEFSGLNSTLTPDGTATNAATGSSSSFSSGTATPSAGKSVLLIAGAANVNNFFTGGPDSGFSASTSSNNASAGYKIVTSASGGYSTNWSIGGGSYSACIAGFDASTGGGIIRAASMEGWPSPVR